MTEETTPPSPPQNQIPAPGPQLALNDLNAVIQIIDVASTRGAFRGEELSQVGGVRDRLALFLRANSPPPEETTASEDSNTAEESTSEDSEQIGGSE